MKAIIIGAGMGGLSAAIALKQIGHEVEVYASETRPLLQGARLTAWELLQSGVDVTLICDNMAAQVMKEGRVQRIFVGADRVDTAQLAEGLGQSGAPPGP